MNEIIEQIKSATYEAEVAQYFEQECLQIMMAMPEYMQDRFWKMMTEYIDVISVLYRTEHHPIISYIAGTPWPVANTLVDQSPENLAYQQNETLRNLYDAWKANTAG